MLCSSMSTKGSFTPAHTVREGSYDETANPAAPSRPVWTRGYLDAVKGGDARSRFQIDRTDAPQKSRLGAGWRRVGRTHYHEGAAAAGCREDRRPVRLATRPDAKAR